MANDHHDETSITGARNLRRKEPKTDEENPDSETTGIAEKVRFWEEQDLINRVLIPRVIRQSELLTKHIAEHDDLPLLVNRFIADAQVEQSRQFEVALEKAVADLNDAHACALKRSASAQAQRHESAMARLEKEGRKLHNRFIAVAVVASVVAMIVAVWA